MLSIVDTHTQAHEYFDDDNELREWLGELAEKDPGRLDQILVTRWFESVEGESLLAPEYLARPRWVGETLISFLEAKLQRGDVRFHESFAARLASVWWRRTERSGPVVARLPVNPQAPDILSALGERERAEHGHKRGYEWASQVWIVDSGDMEGPLNRRRDESLLV